MVKDQNQVTFSVVAPISSPWPRQLFSWKIPKKSLETMSKKTNEHLKKIADEVLFKSKDS